MNRPSLPLLLAACALLAPACGSASGDSREPLPDVPPAVDLPALLDEIKPREGEKAVLVNFWATWCGPCVKEMPELVKLYEDQSGGEVRVVAVSLDLAMVTPSSRIKDIAGVTRFAKRRHFDLPIVVYTGEAEPLIEELRLPNTIPTTLVFNAEGEAGRLEGRGRRQHFDKLIAKATGE